MRQFETGATRDTDTNKPDYEGFLSPAVLEAFGAYMHKNRTQADGKLRDSDNWQKGIPMDAYMKSAWRHFFGWWSSHRRGAVKLDDIMALLFNVQGYAHEYLKAQAAGQAIPTPDVSRVLTPTPPISMKLLGMNLLGVATNPDNGSRQNVYVDPTTGNLYLGVL